MEQTDEYFNKCATALAKLHVTLGDGVCHITGDCDKCEWYIHKQRDRWKSEKDTGWDGYIMSRVAYKCIRHALATAIGDFYKKVTGDEISDRPESGERVDYPGSLGGFKTFIESDLAVAIETLGRGACPAFGSPHQCETYCKMYKPARKDRWLQPKGYNNFRYAPMCIRHTVYTLCREMEQLIKHRG